MHILDQSNSSSPLDGALQTVIVRKGKDRGSRSPLVVRERVTLPPVSGLRLKEPSAPRAPFAGLAASEYLGHRSLASPRGPSAGFLPATPLMGASSDAKDPKHCLCEGSLSHNLRPRSSQGHPGAPREHPGAPGGLCADVWASPT